MRKLISMSVMALLLAVMATTAMAGNVEDCEILKDGNYSKGLYGLCIAWHNAGNDNARESIEKSYEKKAGPGDPPMPGTGGVECLCWNMSEIVEAAATEVMLECGAIPGQEFGVEFAIFGIETEPEKFRPTQGFFVNDSECFHQDFTMGTNFGVDFDEGTSQERIQACRTDIETVCNG